MKARILSLALLMLASTLCSAQYNKRMIRAIKKSLGNDFKGYQFLSYPRNNYGVITSYTDRVNNLNFICDTWFCLGVNNPPADLQQWLTVNDFVAEGEGGSITFSERDKKKFAMDVLLPKIVQVLNVGAGFSSSSVTNTSLSIGTAYVRVVRKAKIQQYLGGLPNTEPMKQAFNEGSLVYIVSDVVIKDLTITISIEQEQEASLKAKVGETGTKVFNSASLEVSATRERAGTYTFSVSKPVIVARLAKKQPGGGMMGNKADYTEWKDVKNLPLPPDQDLSIPPGQ